MSLKQKDPIAFSFATVDLHYLDGRRQTIALPATAFATLGRNGDGTAVLAAQALAFVLDPRQPAPDGLLHAEITCRGKGSLTISRKRGAKTAFEADGETISIDDAAGMRRLFGGEKDDLLAYDGMRRRTPETSIQRALRELLPDGEKSLADLEQRLRAIRDRKRIAEDELRHRTPAADSETDVAEPEALGELLAAIDAERRFTHELISKRVYVHDELDRRRKETRPKLPLTSMLDELERFAAALAEIEKRMAAVKKHAARGLGFITTVALTVATLASGGIFATGQWLHDDALRLLGARLLVLCGVAVVGSVFWRWQGLKKDVLGAKDLRREHESVAAEALKIALRVGHPLDEKEIDSTRLRAAIDRVAERTLARELGTILDDVSDAPESAQSWRQKKMALEGGLSAIAGDRANELPLADLLRAAEQLTGEWQTAVRRSIAAERERTRRDADRELLEDMVRQLDREEKEVKAAIEKHGQRRAAVAAYAERLQNELVPLLGRFLGDRAPKRFDADLSAEWTAAPDESIVRFVVTAAEILVPYRPESRLRLPRVVADPGHDLPDSLAAALIDMLLIAPAAQTIIIFRSRGSSAAAGARTPVLYSPRLSEAVITEGAAVRPALGGVPHLSTAPVPSA